MHVTGLAVFRAVGSLLVSGGPSLAEQDRTADAAMKVAQRKADCPGCDFDFTSRRPLESARRGLVTVGVGVPEGGGYRICAGPVRAGPPYGRATAPPAIWRVCRDA